MPLNPITAHFKHHAPTTKIISKLNAIEKTHRLSNSNDFINLTDNLKHDLVEVKNSLTENKKEVSEIKQKLHKTFFKNPFKKNNSAEQLSKSEKHNLAVKKRYLLNKQEEIREKKRFLKGDAFTLSKPINQDLESCDVVKMELYNNRKKTKRKDSIIEPVLDVSFALGGAAAITGVVIGTHGGGIVPIITTFLSSGGTWGSSILMGRPGKTLRRKFF